MSAHSRPPRPTGRVTAPLVVVLVVALVWSGLPLRAANFAQHGRWSAPKSVAAAAGSDHLANGSPVVASRSSFGSCLAANTWWTNAHDADDTTFAGPCAGGGNVSYSINLSGGVQYRYFRLKADLLGSGGATLIEFGCVGAPGSVWANDPAWGAPHSGSGRWATGSTNDTGIVDLGATYSCAIGFQLTWFSWGATQTMSIHTLEAYATLAPPGDAGSDEPWTFGLDPTGAFSADPVNLATGSFVAQATDLALPGRLLPLSFTRWYNSADPTSGPLGPGWTHSFNWRLTDVGSTVELAPWRR